MTRAPSEPLALYEQLPALETALAETMLDPAERSARLARQLQTLWPERSAACALVSRGTWHVTTLDRDGNVQKDWARDLERELAAGPAPADSDGVASSAPSATARLRRATSARAPALAGSKKSLPNWNLESISSGDRSFGFLGVAESASGRSPRARTRVGLLALAAQRLALLLTLEESRSHVALRDFADLAYGVSHEFNNSLNNLMLQAAVLEFRGLPPETHAELSTIRRLGQHAAGVVRQFQEFARRYDPPRHPIDVHPILASAVAARSEPRETPAIRFEPCPEPLIILATHADIYHLAELLLEDAGEASRPSGSQIVVRTRCYNGRGEWCVEDTGGRVPAQEELHQLFEPFAAAPEPGSRWRLPLCKAIVRRLQGNIQAQAGGGGGLTVCITWRLATPKSENAPLDPGKGA